MMQSMNNKVTVTPGVSASYHDEGVAILNISTGRLFVSNCTGAQIWRGLETEQPLETILDRICESYQVDRELARKHLEAFVSELRRKALVRAERQ